MTPEPITKDQPANSFDNALKETIRTLAGAARSRAKQSESHEKLFEAYKHGGIEGLLRRCNSAMLEHALNTADLIRDELGRQITKEEWQIIKALPLAVSEMRQTIQDTEGFGCCVDKTYHRLAKSIIGQSESEAV